MVWPDRYDTAYALTRTNVTPRARLTTPVLRSIGDTRDACGEIAGDAVNHGPRLARRGRHDRSGPFPAESISNRAVVVVPDGLSGPENKAVRFLVEEVRARSRDRLGRVAPLAERCGPRRRGRPGPSPPLGDEPGPRAASRPGPRPRTPRRASGSVPWTEDAAAAARAGRRQRCPRASSSASAGCCVTLRMSPGKVALPEAARPGLGTQVPAPRPPARLSAQDQLLRRLGPAPVGAVHPRPGRLRHQCRSS